MRIVDRIPGVVGFRVIPTTFLVVLTYVTIFTLVIVTDWLPEVPKHQNGLDLKQAYTDLRHVTAHPHPYNSHYNDAVHAYILSRLRPVAAANPHVHISNDLISNGSWASPGYGVYFEGTNLLVKIDGTNSSNDDGVLFSAHYDSVSTAPGATDDGMGVVTLLQLIEYFAEHRPKRTAIFNINNGEEDWLNGAHAFLQHPWSNLTETFLNLEGAAAGGRPILFRATSTSPVRAFRSDYVPHPHANVISSDAFARGLIRSGTDYSVYTGVGGEMEGLDLAFYKGRSRYHTKYDAVPYTNGGARSLWAMMETAQGAGGALLNAKRHKQDQGSGGAPVYFDLLKAELVIFHLKDLLIYNVVTLVVGPISLVLFVVCEYVIRSEHGGQQNGRPHPRPSVWEWLKQRSWLRALWRRSKFWIALTITIALQGLLVWAYLAFNRFTVYSSPYLVLLSFFSLAYLSLVIPLTFTFTQVQSATAKLILPEREKHTLLIQVYVFTWILLLFSTIAIGRAQIGGLYAVTVWNTGVWIACLLAAVEGMMLPVPHDGPRVHFRNPHPHHHHHEHGEQHDVGHDDEDEHDREQYQQPTEATPLISHSRASLRKQQEGGVVGWWIVHLLLTIPAPVLLIAQMGSLLLDSLPQTLADGSPAIVVYAAASLTAVLLAVPLTPFSGKLHRGLFLVFFTSFLIVTLYLWLAFPFSSADPLKVFFQQKVTLANVVSEHRISKGLSNSTLHAPVEVRKVVTVMTGTPYYLQNAIIPKLPSASGKELKCKDDPLKRGLMTCEWESALVPSPGGRDPWEDDLSPVQGRKGGQSWFRAEVKRTGVQTAQIVLKGRNTRSCRLYFDSRPITKYSVEGGHEGMQKGYEVGETGASEVRLWSRTWDREFVVDFEWEDDDGKEGEGITGRIACEWVEYESASLDNGDGEWDLQGDGEWDLQAGEEERAKIPALEEVLAFLPEWAVVSKTADGLVEAWSPFSV